MSSGNPDLFDCLPRVRRADAEELRMPLPKPGELPWTPFPLIEDGNVRTRDRPRDMADAIEAGRPHRASAELASTC